ncbi:MAG: hypothetical protein Q7R45_07180 [Sulfuricaulis sp.]|nr:hypothetical protein [Sulfuricaulis sp.]
MVLHWPQIVVAALVLIDVGINSARYGQQKTDKYDMTDVLLAPALLVALLYFGGFWTGCAP